MACRYGGAGADGPDKQAENHLDFGTATYRSWTSNRARTLLLAGVTLGAAMLGSSLTLNSLTSLTSLDAGTIQRANAASASEASASEAQAGAAVSAASPAAAARRVVGYFPIWNRNAGYGEANVDFTTVTHVAHFALTPRADGSLIIPDWGPFPDPKLIGATHSAGAKIVLVIGGDDAAATSGFAGLTASAATRQRFVAGVQSMLSTNGYDGVDLDWEFPTSTTDRDNLTKLVGELRTGLAPNKSISLAAPGSSWSGQWLDVPALAPLVDWIGAMTYSLSGSTWSHRSDNNAALFAVDDQALSLDTTRAYYLGRGLPAEKLLLGISFYGQRFEGANAMYRPLNTTGGGTITYPEVSQLIGKGWTQRRDAAAGVPYLTKDGGMGVISYDDPESVALKCQYVRDQQLGGVILWHLGQDRVGSSQPLQQAARACR